MHALLLTVVALGGANARISDRADSRPAFVRTTTAPGQPVARPVSMNTTASHGGCTSCGSAGTDCGCHGGGCNGDGCHGDGCGRGLFDKGGKTCGRGMPQTCYDPRYGCYHSNNRHMNRYPAFHGTFYRRPYNYRNTFDFPWHAEMHEPTSLFSYNVVGEPVNDDIVPPAPPAETARAPRADDSVSAPGAIGTGVATPTRAKIQARPISVLR